MGRLEIYILRGWLVASSVVMFWLVGNELFNEPSAKFDTIEVERINVRESDGTLRLVISNQEKQDGGNVDGIPIHDPGTRPAGMIFFNEHGDEMGGLIFSAKSKEHSGGSLTFDRWKNDQTIQILYSDSKDRFTSGVIVSDRPNDSTMVDLLKRQQQIKKLTGDAKKEAEEQLYQDVKNKKINLGATRLFSGVKDGVAQLALYDADGVLKARISADKKGPGKIELYDENGNLLRQ